MLAGAIQPPCMAPVLPVREPSARETCCALRSLATLGRLEGARAGLIFSALLFGSTCILAGGRGPYGAPSAVNLVEDIGPFGNLCVDARSSYRKVFALFLGSTFPFLPLWNLFHGGLSLLYGLLMRICRTLVHGGSGYLFILVFFALPLASAFEFNDTKRISWNEPQSPAFVDEWLSLLGSYLLSKGIAGFMELRRSHENQLENFPVFDETKTLRKFLRNKSPEPMPEAIAAHLDGEREDYEDLLCQIRGQLVARALPCRRKLRHLGPRVEGDSPRPFREGLSGGSCLT